MKKLDRFLLKSFLGPFVMVFFIVMFILVMQFLWLYIDELAGKGLSLLVILEFMWWGSCTILPMAMPLATLLASIMTLGNLGESNELLAMKAAGVSLKRILYPLIYVAAFISVSAFFISNNLIPISYNKIYTLQYDIGKTKDQIKIPSGTFYNGIEGYSLRIKERNKKTDMMYDLMIYNHTSNKGNTSVTLADSGTIKSTADRKSLILTLYNGISYEDENNVSYRDTSVVLQKISFRRQDVVVPLENYEFEKSDSSRYGNEVMAMNLGQLRHDRDSIGTLNDRIMDGHERKIIYDLSLAQPRQLDTAQNKILVERNAKVEPDTLISWTNAEDEKQALQKAINAVDKAISNMQEYTREVDRNQWLIRRIDLESYRKFTLSLACFIFFFIGAPLGAIIRKGGLGVPVIVSALLFIIYYIIDITGKKLAKDGEATPFMGAFISTFVLLPLGFFMTWAATKDKSFDFKAVGLFFKLTWKGIVAFLTNGKSLSIRKKANG
ncbi:MAG: LptF/LptG family permease [Alistipes sp.]|nr:LptF/LptG family permease [Candidatus Minthomonas equi]